ncbi:hypothetical protein I4F81_012811 [Pyropia yezoensis]|uniref:Uncharacterized protein n=1 Tax=Pyropia yezoensis TaxID=2788 RepID=A0ACC3CJ82_PYRYE|nr:hypothetical protein I4F81_012811 [Neopyropia yezoensis]
MATPSTVAAVACPLAAAVWYALRADRSRARRATAAGRASTIAAATASCPRRAVSCSADWPAALTGSPPGSGLSSCPRGQRPTSWATAGSLFASAARCRALLPALHTAVARGDAPFALALGAYVRETRPWRSSRGPWSCLPTVRRVAPRHDMRLLDGVTASGDVPLILAAKAGHAAVVAALLATGAAEDLVGAGWTALHHAALGGCAGVVKVLLDLEVGPRTLRLVSRRPHHRATAGGDGLRR